jgi:hypothetical protein
MSTRALGDGLRIGTRFGQNPSQNWQITVAGKAPVAETAQHTVQDVSRSRRPSDAFLRWVSAGC